MAGRKRRHSPDAFLAWLQDRHDLTARHIDLIRSRARLLVPKEIAVALGLEVSTVRRLQALTLERLRITGGEKALLRWLADAYARWQTDGKRGAA
jgi:DNA-binding CsgD family transcriptional regulator